MPPAEHSPRTRADAAGRALVIPLPLAKGFALGFIVAAPIGPVGLFCIRESLAGGVRRGLAAAVGAVVGDLIYGAVGAIGMAGIASVLEGIGPVLRWAGAAVLIVLGIVAYRRPLAIGKDGASAAGLREAMLGALVLTLASPMTILSFAAAFAELGAELGSTGTGALMVAGIGLGSAAWWTILAFAAARFRPLVGPVALRWIGRLAGLSIAAFGVAMLLL